MKNISSILFIAFLILSWHHSIAQKIGFVNASNLLSEFAVKNQVESNIRAYQVQMQEKGQQMVNAYQQAYQLFAQKKNRGELSAQQEQAETAKLQSMQEEIVRFEQEAQMQMEKARADLINPINEKLAQEIQTIAREYGYYLIFDSNSILYADPSADISSLVKLKMEERYGSDFKANAPNVTPQVSLPSESVFNPKVISAILEYSKTSGVEILPDGSIKETFADGSYNVYTPGGKLLFYPADGSGVKENSAYETQRAEVPKPLKNFINTQQQETWINGLNQWLAVISEDVFNEIATMLVDDPNGITYYSNLEKTKCSTVYEKLDFRLKFFNKLKSIIQK